MPSNADLSRLFDEFASILEIIGANKFKVIAFQKVARAIDALADEACELAKTPGALEEIDGIGASSAAKIREFAASGEIKELEELRAKVPSGLRQLLGITGIGPKTIKLLWEEGGVTDLASLKTKIASGELVKLPRMGEKTLQKISESIAHAELSAGRIRLGEAAPLAEEAVAYVRSIPGVRRAEYAGSLRRGRDTIGDIDILCAADDPAAAHAAFRTQPRVARVLTSGETKTSIVTGLGVQIDLRTLPLESFGAALMYFTGSKDHNVKLRERAIAQKYRLNEYGLFIDDGKEAPQHRGVKPIVSQTEEEVYAKLGLAYIPPELREERGEIARAEARTLPKLIEITDIKAELHAHTTASDGSLTIERLILAAVERGFHTIAVTDHSKSSVQANGLSPERLREHVAAIRAASKQFPKMSVLAGSEVDILVDGRLDYDDETLALLDIVVASPHASLKQDPDVATKRLIKAIEHPAVRILGHPTGRIVNGRSGLEPDMKRVLAAAKANDVALEINANSNRLDLRDVHVKAAVDAGCLIAINCDTHGLGDLDELRFGILTARRGWLTCEQCINCWDAKRLKKWVARKA